MSEPEKSTVKLYEDLIQKLDKGTVSYDKELILHAYLFAYKAHEGQRRLSGSPYIDHPLEVASVIAELSMDSQTIAAGILHDTVEDTDVTKEKLEIEFGKEIAEMVDGVTKLGKISFTAAMDEQVENLRKMFMAMAHDIRVMIIKLSDRLHNMRTLEFMPDHKRRTKSLETIEVFAPIAHRLGMFKVKVELEDLSLKYLDPISYDDIVEEIEKRKSHNSNYINTIIEVIQKRLCELDIHCEISGRIKHIYSIFKKTYAQGRSMDEIYDIFAVRIIVESIADCYAALGVVHDLFKPLPGRIKDYIAMPKPNMYQSLHTTVIGIEGTPCEVQIRTKEMHRIAEYGIAAHWKYKEGGSADVNVDAKMTWVRQLLELQQDVTDKEEYMRMLKMDMFANEVFVFTPKGDVINLPAGSCPIDFAYSIHSAIGSKMMGAKVNGKLVPLDYTLQNGDIISILTSQSVHGPSRDWLKIVKTSAARNKINQWFKRERREENIFHGKELLDKVIKKSGYSAAQLLHLDILGSLLRRNNLNNLDDLYAIVGYGGLSATNVVARLRDEYTRQLGEKEITEKPEKPIVRTSSNGVMVKGIENCLVRFARCCGPVPGDQIIGYITRGRGVSVHRSDCTNIHTNVIGQGQSDRMIEVEWEGGSSGAYNAELAVLADDRTGMLADIVTAISNMKVATHSLNARTTKDAQVYITMQLEISNSAQLENIIRKLVKIRGVIKVMRNMQVGG